MKPSHGFGVMVAGALTFWLLKDRLTKGPGSAQRLDAPYDLFPNLGRGGATPPPTPSGPTRLPLSNLQVLPGGFYRAAVVVHAPLSWLATVDKVRFQAQSQGFTNVQVSDKKPFGWPGSADADYFVTANYTGSPKTLASSYAGGQVSVVEAFAG